MNLESSWRAYFRKMRGTTRGSPLRVSNEEIFWSWLGAALGIAALVAGGHFLFARDDLHLIIGSFGATAVLLYGATRSPLAQPRNVVGGHLLSALIAVIGSPEIHALGFWYVLMPATLGPLIMIAVALLINNLPRSRRYPEIWF